MGRNMLHVGCLGVAEDIEDSGLKLGCGNAKGLGRRLGVMAGRAGKMTEGVRAVREAEDDDSHHRAWVAAAGRDVRIDGTWGGVVALNKSIYKFINIT
jgi:hypothetical protein